MSMAPVPKDSRDKPKDNANEAGDDPFHNPNIVVADAGDSNSDSDEDYGEDMIVPGGYSLLPSEPGVNQEDIDSDSDSEREDTSAGNVSSPHHNLQDGPVESAGATAVGSGCAEDDILPEAVLSSEADCCAPTVGSEDSGNPAARQKYPFGKIPAYLHVPSLPRDKDGLLWNEKRSGKKQPLDTDSESAIIKAMSGFQLPPESIPPWARNIPEEQWRNQVHRRIACHQDGAEVEQSIAFSKEKPLRSTEADVTSPDQPWVAEFPE